MLPQGGWGRFIFHRCLGKFEGRSHRRHLSRNGMREALLHLTMLHLWICKNAINSVDRATRYGLGFQIFDPPIKARYVRIYPIAWVGHMSLRAEFYGITLRKYCIVVVFLPCMNGFVHTEKCSPEKHSILKWKLEFSNHRL